MTNRAKYHARRRARARALQREVESPERQEALVRAGEYERGVKRRQRIGAVAILAIVGGSILAMIASVL